MWTYLDNDERWLQDNNATIANGTATTNTTAGGDPSGGGGKDAYEFVAFLLWYVSMFFSAATAACSNSRDSLCKHKKSSQYHCLVLF